GRRTYEMAGGDWTDYEFQVPIFVLTRHPPARPDARLAFTFVTDGVESAIGQARTAAGDGVISVARDVVVAGEEQDRAAPTREPAPQAAAISTATRRWQGPANAEAALSTLARIEHLAKIG